jgi:O-glycosyl hydrolase
MPQAALYPGRSSLNSRYLKLAAGGALIVSVASLLPMQKRGNAARITVDSRERFQWIDGFGLNFTGPYFRDDQKAMFDMFIDDLGASLFRVVPYLVYSNWEEVNDNGDPNVMNWEYYNNRYSTPIFEATWRGLRYLNSRGIRPIVALMGPVPDWMADDKAPPPRHRVCEKSSREGSLSHLNPAMYSEFAEEIVSMVMYARNKSHIDFEYFSPFNETDCYPAEGPRIDPDEAPKVLDAVASRLQKEGLADVKLMVPDQAIITNNYTEAILRDARLMNQVGVFSFHTYGEDSVGAQVQRVKSSKYPQTPVWLTEYGDLNDLDKTAENEWKKFSLAANRRALTALNQGANALLYFDAFDDYEECARRMCFYGLFTSADQIYTPKKRYYATRQLYRFVPPGSQRVAARSDAPAITVSAFRNSTAQSLIVVGVKEGGPNQVEVALPAGNELPAAWDLYETTRNVNCLKADTLTVQNGVVQINLPDEVVFTLVGTWKKSH